MMAANSVVGEVMAKLRLACLLMTVSVVLTACAGSQPTAGQNRPSETGKPAAFKRIVAAIRGSTPVLYRKLQVGASYSGLTYLEPMVNAGLVTFDSQGT